MSEFTYESFSTYLKKSGVKLVNTLENSNYKLTEENIINQLYALSDFQRIASNYNGIELKSFNDKTGMYVEKLKMKLKSAKKYVQKIDGKKEKSETELTILETSPKEIKLAEKCIKEIRRCNYLEILKRIMGKPEICIGDTYFDNIQRCDGIKVVSLNRCKMDLGEIDAVRFLRKVNKKKTNYNLKRVIKQYCNYNGLNENSEHFICALLDYPYDYLKWCNKYINHKKNLSEEGYTKKIIKAINRENINLL